MLEHSEELIHAFVREMEKVGFAVHAHAIGDRAVRVALDAFKASREANGEPRHPQSLAHAQLIHPDDRERIGIHDVLAAYTINGAKLLEHDARVGSIEPGKVADLIVLDRNLVELAESGRTAEIGQTRLELTLFDGRVVYEAGG